MLTRDAGSGIPDVVELRKGIYQLGARGGGCKVYLVRGGRKNLLIDAGLPSDFGVLEAQLGTLGISPADISMLVLTHEHIDHIGGVPYFAGHTVVAAHGQAANKIGLQDEFVLMSKAFGRSAEDFHVDIHLQHGSLLDAGDYCLQVLHTPGHCSGAICLYEPEHGLLFSGDTIFGGGTLGGIFPSGNLSDYIGSLKQLSHLRIGEIYPGHGKISNNAAHDFEKALRGSRNLMKDTRSLFDALDSQSEFSNLMKSIAAYSKRI